MAAEVPPLGAERSTSVEEEEDEGKRSLPPHLEQRVLGSPRLCVNGVGPLSAFALTAEGPWLAHTRWVVPRVDILAMC